MSELPNNTIFRYNNGANPYAPDNDSQFYLPLDILGTATDVHGQILGKYLDQLFDYVRFPDDGSNGIEVCGSGRPDCEQGSLIFSTELKDLFIEAFVYNSIQEQIDLYQECVDDTSTQVNEPDDPFCEDQLALLKGIQEGLSNEGLTSSTFFDESIALLFGNKTTIGQVCAYAEGLELETVDDIPGFCCLDAPYEADDWGETVSDTCC